MGPIKNLGDLRRTPHLGKIRLGVKVEPEGKNFYPKATDYFVVPDEIKRYVDDKPKKPDPIRKALNKVQNVWVRDALDGNGHRPKQLQEIEQYLT